MRKKKRVCRFPGCGKKINGGGLCMGHYVQKRKGQKLHKLKHVIRTVAAYPIGMQCSFDGCDKPVMARGLCVAHYYQFRRGEKLHPLRRWGKWTNDICRFKNCKNKRHYGGFGYCLTHYKRLQRFGDPSIKPIGNSGEHNHRWNGGASEYPHHYLMKVLRRAKIAQTKLRCESCGWRATQKNSHTLHLHHVDGSKDNHKMRNVVLVCARCHGAIHSLGIEARSGIIGKHLSSVKR